MGVRNSNIPDYCSLLLGLREILEETIERLDEDDRMGTRPDVSFLEAIGDLDERLQVMKRDLGV